MAGRAAPDEGPVVGVEPLNRRGGTETLMSLWLKGMATRMGVAVLVMLAIALVVAFAQWLA